MHDGHTISAPRHPTWGFGCPGCGAALPSTADALNRAIVCGMPCCGYWPNHHETRRLVSAAMVLTEQETTNVEAAR